jgi:hypothetical protein
MFKQAFFAAVTSKTSLPGSRLAAIGGGPTS